jgi:hypothetical protein
MEVAVTLQGAMAGPDIVPKPNPLRVAVLAEPVPPVSLAPVDVAPSAAPEQAPAAAPPAQPQEPANEPPKEEKKSGWFSGLWN